MLNCATISCSCNDSKCFIEKVPILSDCCTPNEITSSSSFFGVCPSCKSKGKKVGVITLKSLLKPSALETLNADLNYFFCQTPDCDVVYFTNEKTYLMSDMKVRVYQKDQSLTVPACYCFDWTREKIHEQLKNVHTLPTEHIRKNIKANRCGCEVNNPQGSCCLGNVTAYIRELNLVSINGTRFMN